MQEFPILIFIYLFVLEQIQSVSPWKEVDKGTLGRRWDEASPQVWTLEGVTHVVSAARDVDVGIQLQQLAAFQSHTFLELGNCTPKNKHTYQKVSSCMNTTLPMRNEIHAPIFL